MSTKISLEFPLLTDTLEADEFIVDGLKMEKFVIFDRELPPLPFVSLTTSLAISGLMCEVFVS